MDVVNLLKNLSVHITCSVCLQVFDEPRTLDCGHTYCLKCLKKIKRKRNEQISCPDCRTLSGGSEDSLPIAFHMNSLIDVFRIQEYEATPVKCDICNKFSQTASYCFQCAEFFCQECLNAHSLLKRSHRVLALPMFTDVDIQHVIERPAFCSVENHKDELKKYFCITCKVPVCQKCTTVEHGGHTFEDIEATVEKFRKKMRAKIDGAKNKLQEIMAAKQKMTDEKNTIEDERQRVEQELNGTANKIKECFEKLIQDNCEKAAKAQIDVDEQLNKAHGLEEEAQNLISDATAALSTILPGSLGSNAAMTDLDHKLELIQDRQIEPIEKAITSYQPSTEFEKVLKEENVGRIHQCRMGFPKVQGTTIGNLVAGIKANMTVNNIIIIIMIFTAIALAIQQSPEQQFKVVKVFGKKGAAAGEFKGPLSLSVDTDGSIAVCDSDNHRIQVFNNNGDLVRRPFGMEVLSYPVSIAHLHNAGNHGNHILVSDLEKGVIQMFTNNGDFVKTWWAHDGIDLLHGRLSIDETGDVIVCLRKHIMLLSPEGKAIRVLVSEEEGISPMFCVYHDGKYYVTEYGRTSVKVFNKHGQRVQEFRDKDGNVHILDHPRGIAIDKNGRVIVCEHGGHKLHVYLKGILVKTIGSKGDKPGEFQYPIDVKLLPDGRIAVSDDGNHRIQILV